MFSFVKKKLAEEALDETAKFVVARLETLSPIERAQSLAVTNSLMIAGSKVYGADFAMKPTALAEEIAIDAVLEMRDRQHKLLASTVNLEGMSAGNPIFAAFKRELSACEVAMMTAGAAFHPGARAAAPKCWRLLSKSTPFAKYAVEVLLLYQKTHSLNAVVTVNGETPDAKLLYSLASVLLPLFRPKGK
jgi:hypothetical protein